MSAESSLCLSAMPAVTVRHHREDVSLLQRQNVPKQVSLLREDSLGSQMSKPQLLKRKWSEDMPQNVRMARESLRKPWAGESARRAFYPKATKAAKMAAFGDA
eukprot:2381810-Prymnesium_polylepis.1